MKLASIGSGAIVDRAYEAIAELANPDIETVGAYSRTAEKARAYADKHGLAKSWHELDALMADPDVDTIYIATPNSLHYEQARKALEAGKNVILEKPFTSTLAQAKELFDIAEAHHVMIFEAITSIHTANYHLLKKNLEKAGTIRMVTLNFSQLSSRYHRYLEGEVENVFNPKFDGGALVDINVYNIYLCVALFGMPKNIHYFADKGWNGIDTGGVVIMTYDTFQAVCIGCKDCSSDELYYIQGDGGTFEISQGSSGKLARIDFEMPHRPGVEKESIQISIDQGHHMKYEFDDFEKAIDTHDWKTYEKYKEKTLEVMELLERCKMQRDA